MKKTDTTTYLQKNVKIRKDNKLIPFKLKPVQKDVLKIIGENKKVIFLKARQLGITSAITGYLYHYAITNRNTISILIGYNNDLTAELLGKIKTFWKTTPKKLQPKVEYKSRFEIYFPKTNSTLFFISAYNTSPVIKSIKKNNTLANNIFASEVAVWDDAEEKIEELEQVLDSNGKFIIESSPHKIKEDGKVNYLYKLWTENNDWHKKRYDWHWGYSPKEIDIIKKKFVDPKKFAREYENVFLADMKKKRTKKWNNLKCNNCGKHRD